MMNNFGKFFVSALILILTAGTVIYFVDRNSDRPYFSESRNDSSLALANYQQNLINNQALNDLRQNIITETVKQVSPAVVGISVIEMRQYRDPFDSFFNDPFFRQFFGDRGTNNRKVKGLGSGYIISPDGYILTNDHVAGNASEITVTLTSGNHYSAKIIGTDPVSDICLLKIDGEDFPFIILGNSEDIIIGEWVIALGNPFGLFNINDKPTVTVGVISATGMNLEPINNRYYLNMLQTDAAINGGNSGGPLVNSLGDVIGMNTLIFTAGGAQGSIGLGFAIPINKVKRIVTELKEKGEIDRNFDIGLRIQSIDEGIANYYNLPSTKGVIITQVAQSSPAVKAGLKIGDLIIEVEGYKISNEQTLVGVFQEFRSGQVIDIKIIRDNVEFIKKMKLEKIR